MICVEAMGSAVIDRVALLVQQHKKHLPIDSLWIIIVFMSSDPFVVYRVYLDARNMLLRSLSHLDKQAA
jgi:hypothetical protein